MTSPIPIDAAKISKASTRLVLLKGDLVDAALMTSTLEGSLQIALQDLSSLRYADEASREYEYIGVIVGTHQLSDLTAPRQPCSDVGILIESHRHAIAGATDRDASLHVATLYALSQLMGIVRIVATLLLTYPIVYIVDVSTVEHTLHLFL